MSIKAMEWAGAIQVGKGSHKAVLLALAWFHHEKKGECRRSIAAIVAWTELNRKTVIAALEWLEKADLIATEKRYGAPSNYRLNFAQTSPKNGTGGKQGTSTNFGTGGGDEPVPKTVPVPNLEPVPKTDLNQYQKRTKPVPNLGHDKVGKDIGNSIYRAREGISTSASELWEQHLAALGRNLTTPIVTSIQNTLSAYDETTQLALVNFAISGQYANLERARGHFHGDNRKNNGPGVQRPGGAGGGTVADKLRAKLKPVQ